MRYAVAMLVAAGTFSLMFAQTAPRKYDVYAHFNTSMGEIVAQLYPERTPVTVENFIALAEGKKATLTKDGQLVHKPFYNGLTFHRVIKGFMIQAGEIKDRYPCGTANIHDEIDSARTFGTVGALAMANAGRPNSANCQIFITVAPQKAIDGTYAIFGQVVSGQDVADKISEVPVKGERPITPVILKSVTIERRPR